MANLVGEGSISCTYGSMVMMMMMIMMMIIIIIII